MKMLGAVGCWLGFMIGNLLSCWLFNMPWERLADRSFFETAAMLAMYLSLR